MADAPRMSLASIRYGMYMRIVICIQSLRRQAYVHALETPRLGQKAKNREQEDRTRARGPRLCRAQMRVAI